MLSRAKRWGSSWKRHRKAGIADRQVDPAETFARLNSPFDWDGIKAGCKFVA